jgi:DNA-binding XRE family transcriptional regulator
MSADRYRPVPLDVDATRARWMKRKGFRETYGSLADEYATLGELLRARQAAGMTQADVAEAMGVAQSSIARLESSAGNRRHAPSIATLRRYAEAVGCELRITLAAKPAQHGASRKKTRAALRGSTRA